MSSGPSRSVTSSQSDKPVLLASALTKRYGSVTVLDNVALELYPGEVHALVGANGAGKSTLSRILSGLITPTSGRMELNGVGFAPDSKKEAEAAGIQIVQQELNLVPTLTVAENLQLNQMPQCCGWINRAQLDERAKKSLHRLGLDEIAPQTLVSSLGVGQQQMVEIAAVLDRECRLLILDEPTAALSGAESERLFAQIEQLRNQGVAMIYISHRLDEVLRLSNRISILRNGKLTETLNNDGIEQDHLVDLMSGTVQSGSHQFQSFASDPVVFRLKELTGPKLMQPVSFEVHQGERLGIAGLIGSGRTELLRLIFGADRATQGTIQIGNRSEQKPFDHPNQAVQAGLAMVTEDRKASGLCLDLPVRQNATLTTLKERFQSWGRILQRNERTAVAQVMNDLDLQATSNEQPVFQLSGGNQQKVVVGKWLLSDAEVYLFDEPTRGIDLPARRRLYRLFEQLSQQGKGLVIVSSDLEELFQTCDRIGVMSAGQYVGSFSRDQFSEEIIMQAAFSAYRSSETTSP